MRTMRISCARRYVLVDCISQSGGAEVESAKQQLPYVAVRHPDRLEHWLINATGAW